MYYFLTEKVAYYFLFLLYLYVSYTVLFFGGGGENIELTFSVEYIV